VEEAVDYASELEDAFERGRDVGRKEGAMFKGIAGTPPWTNTIEFRWERSWFDAYADYERRLLEQLRRVQRTRWIERQHEAGLAELLDQAERAMQTGRETARRRKRLWERLGTQKPSSQLEAARRDMGSQLRLAGLLEQLQEEIEQELHAARRAVDAELSYGRGRACIVQAMRSNPERPRGVREFSSVHEFVEADRRRALPDWPARIDAGGADYGYQWRLENPLRRWETTRWRISWLCEDDPAHEIYAIERLPHPDEVGLVTGRVWLLGVLGNRRLVDEALSELSLHAENERNSLIVAAESILAVVRRDRGASLARSGRQSE
jgi:hypothetical protein